MRAHVQRAAAREHDDAIVVGERLHERAQGLVAKCREAGVGGRLAAARRAGATILLSEDMQDGLEVDGLRVVNPFVAGNDAFIELILRSA